MAIGTLSQMKIYDEQFQSGAYEVLTKELNAFNAASLNALRLVQQGKKGYFDKAAFWQYTSNLVTRRDVTSNAAVTPTSMAQGEHIGVKIFRKVGPVQEPIEKFKIQDIDLDEMAFLFGAQSAPEIVESYLQSVFSSLVGSFSLAGVTSSNVYTGASARTIESLDLNNALKKMGDKSSRVKIWIMTSKVYRDLIGDQIANKFQNDSIGAYNLFQGLPATMGIPVLVIDQPALFAAGSGTSVSTDDEYWTFGLTEDAAEVAQSEETSTFMEAKTLTENLTLVAQSEYAYNVKVKGLSYTSATPNPTDANLATSTSWTKIANSFKDLPGIAIKTR